MSSAYEIGNSLDAVGMSWSQCHQEKKLSYQTLSGAWENALIPRLLLRSIFDSFLYLLLNVLLIIPTTCKLTL